MTSEVSKKLAKAGVFKGFDGLEGLAECQDFWDRQPYGTRLYFGPGGGQYLHRGILRAAIRLLNEPTPDVDKLDAQLNAVCVAGCSAQADVLVLKEQLASAQAELDILRRLPEMTDKLNEVDKAKQAVLEGAFGICSLPELELFQRMETVYWKGFKAGYEVAKIPEPNPAETQEADPFNLKSCTHPECGRFYDHNARRMMCRAMADGACAVETQEPSDG